MNVVKYIEQYPFLQNLLKRFMKFSVVGAVSTIVSLSASVILLKYYKTPLIPTYIGVYGSTILLSYVLNSFFTFKSRFSVKKMLLYFGVYLSSMCVGVLVLSIYRAILPFENWVLPFFTFPVTMTWNFTFASRILKPTSS